MVYYWLTIGWQADSPWPRLGWSCACTSLCAVWSRRGWQVFCDVNWALATTDGNVVPTSVSIGQLGTCATWNLVGWSGSSERTRYPISGKQLQNISSTSFSNAKKLHVDRHISVQFNFSMHWFRTCAQSLLVCLRGRSLSAGNPLRWCPACGDYAVSGSCIRVTTK